MSKTRSARVCPKCKGRATKIVNLSTDTYTCQQCGHIYPIMAPTDPLLQHLAIPASVGREMLLVFHWHARARRAEAQVHRLAAVKAKNETERAIEAALSVAADGCADEIEKLVAIFDRELFQK